MTQMDTCGPSQFDIDFQALNPVLVKFTSYNFSLSLHKSGKVYSFVPRSRASINDLHQNICVKQQKDVKLNRKTQNIKEINIRLYKCNTSHPGLGPRAMAAIELAFP